MVFRGGESMNKWIHAEDCLPEEGKKVLVYGEHAVYGVDKKHNKTIETGKVRNGKWVVNFPISFRVISWMDLPIPKEGE